MLLKKKKSGLQTLSETLSPFLCHVSVTLSSAHTVFYKCELRAFNLILIRKLTQLLLAEFMQFGCVLLLVLFSLI